MKRFSTPFHLARPMLESARMLVEAQQVIALHLAGIAGIWPISRAETKRMVDEKTAAKTESAQAVLTASPAGKSPGDVAMAAIRPLRRRTRANARRLTRMVGTGGAA